MNTVGIKFLYFFSVGEYSFTNPGSNIISVTSTAAGHDKKNLTTTPLRETWRSDSNIASWQEIVIQANSTAIVPDIFALLNHNLTDLAVVQIQGSMTTSFVGAPTLTFQVTEKHMVLLQDWGTAYLYYKIRILDPTNPCGYLDIGRIIGGRAFTVSYNEDITDEISVSTDDLAYKMRTEGFFRAFNERVKIDKLSFRFSKLVTVAPDNANYLGLKKMFNLVGETFPFLTVVDPADQAFQIVWGHVMSIPGRGFGINRYVDMSVQIEEVY